MAVPAQSTPESLESFAALRFSKAAPIWYEIHCRSVGPGTQRHYTNCIKQLMKFFGQLRLDEIRLGHVEGYQNARSKGEEGMHAAGASLVNHELNTLLQILGRAGLRESIERLYKPMRLPRPKVGCALDPEDEERLFRIASSNPRWKVAYCCAIITANTTAGPGEIRHLRLRDIDLNAKEPSISVPDEGAKNQGRMRDLPLNPEAAAAVAELLKRARENGASAPDHYLLPHRARNGKKGFDATRPISTWRSAWDKLKDAAGLPHLRRYDLRHHAITKLLENEKVSERTVIELAGHVSNAMLKRYSHIRKQSKIEAVNGLSKTSSMPAAPTFLMTSGTISFILPSSSTTSHHVEPEIPRKPPVAIGQGSSQESSQEDDGAQR